MKKQCNLFKLLFLFLAMFSFLNVHAQEMTVTGVVTDALDGMPLPGVTVAVKGTTNGTITTPDGLYTLNVEKGSTLVYSFIGFKSQEVIVSQSTIDVVLEEDVFGVDEVVVIGYGTVKKEDATGSVVAVSAKDFNKGAITSPQDLIVGKSSGVQITSAGGAPGAGSTIRIRGGSSMSASNDPLIIVDGVPLDTEGVAGMANPLNTINPNDIETFTVLKDASATAIYGSRASNGVIIITTKKGKAGQTTFNYSGNVSMATAANKVDVMNGDEYRAFIADTYGENSDATALLGKANTDWQDQIYRNAISTEHNFSASGGIAGMPYRASIGYSNQNGILKTSNMERITASFNYSPNFFDNHLKTSFSLKGMNIQNQFANTRAVGDAVVFDPTQEVYTPSYPGFATYNDGSGDVTFPIDRSYGGYTTWVDNNGLPIPIAPMNPVALLNMHDDQSDVNRFIGNAKFDYQLHFFPDVVATLNMGIDASDSDGRTFVSDTAPWAYQEEVFGNEDPQRIARKGGTHSTFEQKKRNSLLDAYATYTPSLESINSSLKVMVGYSWQHFHREGFDYSTNLRGDVVNNDRKYATENYLVSFMGRIEYGFQDKYLATLTFRRDGTSRFVGDNKWGTFPAAALAWKVNKESFLEDSEVVSDLKIRAGWGITGQQNITGSDYPALALYTKSLDTAMYPWDSPTNYIYTYRPEDYDPNLKWEETTTINAGVDFGFLNQRITGSFDFYKRDTENLINTIPLAAGGLKNIRTTNVGSLTNSGVEFGLNFKPIVRADFFWDVGFNFTYNVNQITNLTNVDDPSYLGVETGGIAGGTGSNVQIHSVGYATRSFFVYEQVYDDAGNPIEGVYVDRNGDGVINNFDKYHYKQAAPDILMGINTRLNYKNWDFSMSGRIQLGNYAYNNNQSDKGIRQNAYTSAGFLGNRLKSASGSTGFNDYQYWSDLYVQDASFFRLDNVSLGYNFKGLMDDKLDIRVNLTGQNLLVVTPYEGLDPEVESGIDNNFYPRPRTFMLGVNLAF